MSIIYLEIEENLVGVENAEYKIARKFVDIVQDEVEALEKIEALISQFPHFADFKKRLHICHNEEGHPCEFVDL